MVGGGTVLASLFAPGSGSIFFPAGVVLGGLLVLIWTFWRLLDTSRKALTRGSSSSHHVRHTPPGAGGAGTGTRIGVAPTAAQVAVPTQCSFIGPVSAPARCPARSALSSG